MENIKSLYILEVAIYRNNELYTSNVLGLYSTIYKCLNKLLQLEEGITEWEKVDFLSAKLIRFQYPTGEYVYTATL